MKRILVILALMMAGYPLLAQDDTVTSAQKSMDEIQTDAVRREHDQPVDNTTRTKKQLQPTRQQQVQTKKVEQ